MTMIRDAIESILAIGKKAADVQTFTSQSLPDVVFLRTGESVTEKKIPPQRIVHNIARFDDFVEYIARIQTGDIETHDHADVVKAPMVFVGPQRIVCVIDPAVRKDFVTMPLLTTERWKTLVTLSAPAAIGPAELVKLLRFKLNGTGQEKLIADLRRVDFTRTNAGRSDVAHGRETLGKSVEAEVQQAENIPDSFLVETSVYSNPGLRDIKVKVRVGIYIDVINQHFEVGVMPDELQLAIDRTAADVSDKLQAALPSVPTFIGSPSP